VRLGILTGSLVAIPVGAREGLLRIADDLGIPRKNIRLRPMRHDESFLTVDVTGSGKHASVRLVTDLFNQGWVNVLVGTKSLLGEGWDAPSINALVLATFVGSYMLSNQMRGRAIRSIPGFPDKTANIWHLVCVEEDEDDPGHDMETMDRRFKAFVGLSQDWELTIENGFQRLYMPRPPIKESAVKRQNSWTEGLAKDRPRLVEMWKAALEYSTDARMVYQVLAPESFIRTGFVFYGTIAARLLIDIMFTFAILTYTLLFLLLGLTDPEAFWSSGFLGYFVLLLLFDAYLIYQNGLAIWLAVRYGPVATSIVFIGQALLSSLIETRVIRTPPSKLKVKAEKMEFGEVYCSLTGATYYETQVFLDSFQEILDPIGNPRYLMVRKTLTGKKVKEDFHAVPEVLGSNKKRAEIFQRHWKKAVGPCELVFTRTIEGRKMLLQARQDSLSGHIGWRSEKASQWK
jgi:hypothetical protein